MTTRSTTISTIRLYGSAIAIVSGAYSVYLSTTGAGMTIGAWGMLVLGVVVLIHGVVLLTPAVAQLSTASGPLMIGYSILMLANQAWMTTGMGQGTSGMNGGMMGDPMTSGMGSDAGMIALAVLMLVSGVIMTVRRDMLP